MSFGAAARRIAGLAMRQFGWTPDTFWAATPDDVAMIVAAHGGAAPPPDRATRDALMEQYPDAR